MVTDKKSGDKYFWNKETNKTSWERPKAPPPPASAGSSGGGGDDGGGGGGGDAASEERDETEGKEPYVAAERFAGARAAYVFKAGPLGLGYYVDVAAAADRARAKAKAKAQAETVAGGDKDASKLAAAAEAETLPAGWKKVIQRSCNRRVARRRLAEGHTTVM